MSLSLSTNFSRLDGESAFDTLRAARAREALGKDIVHLEIGQPDFTAPPHVIEAGINALRDGHTRYAPSAGLPVLREAVAAAFVRRGVNATAEQIIVTPGAKNALFCALSGLVESGDEVLMPSIGFPSYAQIVRFLGGKPVYHDLDAERGFPIDVARIAASITPRTRVLVLSSPHNPTGSAATRHEIEQLAELALAHDLAVVTDEIYADLQYDGQFVSIASIPELAARTVIVDGLSKNFAMTGWRLGYAVVPLRHAGAFERFATHNFSCTAPFTQLAAVAALNGPQTSVLAARDEYARRAALMVGTLARLPGVRCHQPRGAFYAFPDLRALLAGTGLTTKEVAKLALDDFDVAVLPGTAFGAAGEGFLRLSFAQPAPVLERGLDRLAQCLATLSAPSAAVAR
jgi:aspartate aminotransferase